VGRHADIRWRRPRPAFTSSPEPSVKVAIARQKAASCSDVLKIQARTRTHARQPSAGIRRVSNATPSSPLQREREAALLSRHSAPAARLRRSREEGSAPDSNVCPGASGETGVMRRCHRCVTCCTAAVHANMRGAKRLQACGLASKSAEIAKFTGI